MLHEFLLLNREAIIEATAAKALRRGSPTLSIAALRTGVPLFLGQVADTLREEAGAATDDLKFGSAIADGATRHGAELLLRGFTVSEVVHFYGDICQAVTELAVAHEAPVSVDEFRILNRSLDTAIATSVTEHARLTAERTSQAEQQRMAQLAHELRNQIQTASLAFSALKNGQVAVNGSTSAVLGRCLTTLRALIESTLSEVRLTAANPPPVHRIIVDRFLHDVAASAALLADHHDIRFEVKPSDPADAVDGDEHLLCSAVMNLLQNAFKFTRPGGVVVLRSHREHGHVIIEVEDQCGGLDTDLRAQSLGHRQARDRAGLGLGLAIARQAVHTHRGDLHFHNVPGVGCVFSVELPLAANPSGALV